MTWTGGDHPPCHALCAPPRHCDLVMWHKDHWTPDEIRGRWAAHGGRLVSIEPAEAPPDQADHPAGPRTAWLVWWEEMDAPIEVGDTVGRPSRGRPRLHRCTYRRHLAAGEPPCDACAKAERERQAALYQRRKARRVRPAGPDLDGD